MAQDVLAALRAVQTGETTLGDRALALGHELATPELIPPHAIEGVFAAPDAIAVLAHGEARLALATKRAAGFCWIVPLNATIDPTHPWVTVTAYRLPASGPDLDELTPDPAAAFARLLERHGLDFAAGDATVRFGKDVHVPMRDGQVDFAALGLDPDAGLIIAQPLRIHGRHHADAPFLYVIDTDSYRNGIRAALAHDVV